MNSPKRVSPHFELPNEGFPKTLLNSPKRVSPQYKLPQLYITLQIPLGLSISVTIRVGQQLGANRPMGAMTSHRVAISIILCTATIIAAIYLALNKVLPYVFASDKYIIY